MLFIFAVGLCSGAFFEIYMKGGGQDPAYGSAFRAGLGRLWAKLFFHILEQFKDVAHNACNRFFRSLRAASCCRLSFFPHVKGSYAGIFSHHAGGNFRRQRILVHNFNHTSAKPAANTYSLRSHRHLDERGDKKSPALKRKAVFYILRRRNRADLHFLPTGSFPDAISSLTIITATSVLASFILPFMIMENRSSTSISSMSMASFSSGSGSPCSSPVQR